MSTQRTRIDEVLHDLDAIIEETVRENNMLGIFAYVYRRTTAEIKRAIEEGVFEDNPRMERFDVRFAGYYLDAYHAWKTGQPVSRAWMISFDSRQEPLAILQHLLMGMNAHINLDLGVTASESVDGQDIEHIHNDFNKVNEILFGLTEEFQSRLSRVSPSIFLMDWIGKNSDERIANFSIKEARNQSWRNALLLANLQGQDRSEAIETIDQSVMQLSALLIRPKSRLLRFVWSTIRFFEEKNVGVLLQKLEQD
jgi:hypothetical protein